MFQDSRPSELDAASPMLSRVSSRRSSPGRPSLASPRVGVKSQLQGLERMLEEQRQLTDRLSRQVVEYRKESQALVREVNERWAKAYTELQEEHSKRFKQVVLELQQANKANTARKGETNILAQQLKEANRRITELQDYIDSLRVEVMGE